MRDISKPGTSLGLTFICHPQRGDVEAWRQELAKESASMIEEGIIAKVLVRVGNACAMPLPAVHELENQRGWDKDRAMMVHMHHD